MLSCCVIRIKFTIEGLTKQIYVDFQIFTTTKAVAGYGFVKLDG